MLRIGIRAHDMGKYSLENLSELCEMIKVKGAQSIQLALNKSFHGMENLEGKLTPGLGNFIGANLKKHDLDVSVLGSYINMANPDDEMMLREIEKFKEHLRLSKFIGNAIVGTETGCYNREYRYTVENESEEAFDRFIETLKIILKHAEKLGVLVGIEGVATHIVNTPKKMKRVLDQMKSENLVVIFDPVNFLTEKNYHSQDEIIRESFRLFGDKIAVIHAKDYIIKNGKIEIVPATFGEFNYKLLIDILKEKKPGIDILLENSTIETAEKIIEKLQKI
ncbi:MAG: sugar phosphate isomerase/epimerase family protein [Fusobacteriaceae bacterium]